MPDGGGKIHDRNPAVQHFVPQCPHDFGAGIIFGGVHTLAAGSASVRGNHGAVRLFVKFHTEPVQPQDGIRRFGDQFAQQFGFCRKMPAPESVQIMLGRRIVGFIRGLNTAFRHHRIGVPDAQFRHHQHLGARLMRFNCSAGTGAASANHQDIRIIVRRRQIDFRILDAAFSLQQGRQFHRHLFTLIRPDFQLRKFGRFVIRMEGRKQIVFFFRSHPARFHGSIGFALGGDILHGFQHFFRIICIHPYLLTLQNHCSISRVLYSSLISSKGFCMRSSIKS